MLKPTKFQARNRISRAVAQITELQQSNTGTEEFKKWRRNTRIAISYAFGDESQHVEEFKQISFVPYYSFADEGSENVKAYRDGLIRATALLESMIEEIEEYWSDDTAPRAVSETREISQQQVSNRVFVVHGRDLGTKDTVARFLESLDLNPIILQEQPNEGRTIVEKFEDYADVGFAVVLCTPDDVGALSGDEANLRLRPRQNVVLEWGFFFGRLGRNRVCALLKGDVEIPSDYSGVLYIRLEDSGAWQMELAREMRRADLPVDMNRLA